MGSLRQRVARHGADVVAVHQLGAVLEDQAEVVVALGPPVGDGDGAGLAGTHDVGAEDVVAPFPRRVGEV